MFKKVKSKLQAIADKRRPDTGLRGLQVFVQDPQSGILQHGTVCPVTIFADGTVRKGAPVFGGDIADCWRFLKNYIAPFPERYRSQWKVTWQEPVCYVCAERRGI